MLWDRVLSLAGETAALHVNARGKPKPTIVFYTVHNAFPRVKRQWARDALGQLRRLSRLPPGAIPALDAGDELSYPLVGSCCGKSADPKTA